MQTHPHYNESVPTDWRAYSGVLSRRSMAFIIDYILVGVLMLAAIMAVFVLGLLTFGLGWMLYPVLFFIVAGLYFGLSLAGTSQATPGMRVTGIRLMRADGRRMDFVTAIVHLALFWILNSVLTPFILLVGLFTDRGRLVHDIILGTTMVRTA